MTELRPESVIIYEGDRLGEGVLIMKAMEPDLLLPMTHPMRHDGAGLYIQKKTGIIIIQQPDRITLCFIKEHEDYARLLHHFAELVEADRVQRFK